MPIHIRFRFEYVIQRAIGSLALKSVRVSTFLSVMNDLVGYSVERISHTVSVCHV